MLRQKPHHTTVRCISARGLLCEIKREDLDGIVLADDYARQWLKESAKFKLQRYDARVSEMTALQRQKMSLNKQLTLVQKRKEHVEEFQKKTEGEKHRIMTMKRMLSSEFVLGRKRRQGSLPVLHHEGSSSQLQLEAGRDFSTISRIVEKESKASAIVDDLANNIMYKISKDLAARLTLNRKRKEASDKIKEMLSKPMNMLWRNEDQRQLYYLNKAKKAISEKRLLDAEQAKEEGLFEISARHVPSSAFVPKLRVRPTQDKIIAEKLIAKQVEKMNQMARMEFHYQRSASLSKPRVASHATIKAQDLKALLNPKGNLTQRLPVYQYDRSHLTSRDFVPGPGTLEHPSRLLEH